ncbi:NADH-ubiquinone oxidoreductase chain 4 [Armadillidium vulgare]|nr:NADH-ubiquinone oxidoreductase chain 4 [Armadillidium vulgare]
MELNLFIIGHGFCSSGLFCIANISYERINTRSLFIIKGLQTSIPVIRIVLVFLAAAYSLFLFSQTQHGKLPSKILTLTPASLRE